MIFIAKLSARGVWSGQCQTYFNQPHTLKPVRLIPIPRNLPALFQIAPSSTLPLRNSVRCGGRFLRRGSAAGDRSTGRGRAHFQNPPLCIPYFSTDIVPHCVSPDSGTRGNNHLCERLARSPNLCK